MPNWCTNYVTFQGGDLEALRTILLEGEKECNETGKGWLPAFAITNAPRYLFDMGVDEGINTSVTMRCESKWCPPTNELHEIAKQYGCTMEVYYEELGMMIFGRATGGHNAPISDIWLTDEEMEAVTYDDDTGNYLYKGKLVESDTEIYEELLQSKIENL